MCFRFVAVIPHLACPCLVIRFVSRTGANAGSFVHLRQQKLVRIADVVVYGVGHIRNPRRQFRILVEQTYQFWQARSVYLLLRITWG